MAIVDVVLKKIESLTLEEEDRLPSERALANTCGVSRTSMRNALKELQSRRILAVKQGSGYFLASHFALEQAISGEDTAWSIERIQQTMEARRHIEPHVVAISVVNMEEKDVGKLEACLVALGEATVGKDASTAVHLHRKFFKIIEDCCSNREFIRMLGEVRIPLGYTIRVIEAALDQEKNALFSEHVNLLQLIKKKEFTRTSEISERINRLATELFIKYQSAITF